MLWNTTRYGIIPCMDEETVDEIELDPDYIGPFVECMNALGLLCERFGDTFHACLALYSMMPDQDDEGVEQVITWTFSNGTETDN